MAYKLFTLYFIILIYIENCKLNQKKRNDIKIIKKKNQKARDL